MKEKDFLNNVVIILLFSILPLIAILILSFGSILFFCIEKHGIILTYVNMIISFVIIPYIFFEYFFKNAKLTDIGLKRPDILTFITVCIATVTVMSEGIEEKTILFALQVFPIAFSEEFWARGIMYYISKEAFGREYIAIILSSIIFAFITHINRPVTDNFFYRLPGALLLGCVFYKTKRLDFPIAIHFLNNFLGGV